MGIFTFQQHFDRQSSHVYAIYDAVLSTSAKIGNFVEDPKKTSIRLNRKLAFAGIQTRKNFLILTVKSSSEIENERISKQEKASANRWHCEIKLTEPRDVDAEIERWLRTSYELSN